MRPGLVTVTSNVLNILIPYKAGSSVTNGATIGPSKKVSALL